MRVSVKTLKRKGTEDELRELVRETVAAVLASPKPVAVELRLDGRALHQSLLRAEKSLVQAERSWRRFEAPKKGGVTGMWWKVLLRAAVALGLDKWAERKAGELIRKGLDALRRKSSKLAEAVPESAAVTALANDVEAFASIAGAPAAKK